MQRILILLIIKKISITRAIISHQGISFLDLYYVDDDDDDDDEEEDEEEDGDDDHDDSFFSIITKGLDFAWTTTK